MNRYKFAIVGCGISGLSTGRLLAQAGHDVTIFEKFQEPKSVGAGLLLQPSGLVALEMLGLRDEVESKGSRIDALIGTTGRGRRVMDVRYADAWPGVYGVGIHRGNLFRCLYDHAIAAGVSVRCGVEIDSIQVDRKQKYTFRAVNDECAGAYDAVVIANGTQSTLRSFLNVPMRSVPYPWGALWAICPDPARQFQGTLSQRYCGASVMIGVLPSGVHPQTGVPCVSFFWSMQTKDQSKWCKRGFEFWKSDVLAYWPELDDLLASLADESAMTFATYGDVLMSHWHDGGLLCIGDAGHGMSPQLGMGANLALMDGIVLADCVDRSTDIAGAFALYSQRRRGHLKFNQFASRWLTPLFQSNSRVAAFVRDSSFPLLHRIPSIYRQSLRTVAGVKTGLLFDRPLMDLSQSSGASDWQIE